LSAPVRAQDNDLAKQLSNPISSLISFPFQMNWDQRIGPARDGDKFTLNIQPVIPWSLGPEWNMISRTILPIAGQSDIFPGAGSQQGFGSTLQSLFFSPVKPAGGWLIWGIGPAISVPTTTDPLLGSYRWGAGPTGVFLTQQGPWTIGILTNHIWSVTSSTRTGPVDQTFLQPFIAYAAPDSWTITLNSESTYDWTTDAWSVPVNFTISKIVRIGNLPPVSLGGTVGYWVESPESGPHGWRFRFTTTLLFPK
jgi:hypothetical protein